MLVRSRRWLLAAAALASGLALVAAGPSTARPARAGFTLPAPTGPERLGTVRSNPGTAPRADSTT